MKAKLMKDIKEHGSSYILLLLLCFFVILQFFLQVSFSIMKAEIAHTFNLDAAGVSLLASSFFWTYIPMQIPAGFLLDQFGLKTVCFYSLVLMGLSSFIFGASNNLTIAYTARIFMGLGATAGFIAMLKGIHHYFPIGKFILLLSMSEFIGMIGLQILSVFFSYVTDATSWRMSFYICGFLSFVLAACLLQAFRKAEDEEHSYSNNEKETRPSLKLIIENVFLNKTIWLNGLYAFFFYVVINVFCGLQGAQFTEKLYLIPTWRAQSIVGFIYFGLGFASLFLSMFVNRLGLASITRISPLVSLILMVIYIYYPPSSQLVSCLLMFLLGIGCASYQLAFGIVSQNVQSRYQSTASGLTNMILMASAPILSPMVGFALTLTKGGALDGRENYTLADYRVALIILPLSLLLSFVFSLFILPKKVPKEISHKKYNKETL